MYLRCASAKVAESDLFWRGTTTKWACGYSSDTKQKNPRSASTPTGIAGRGILVGRQRRKKHPSCAPPAAQRDEGNLEPPLGRSLPWRHILHLSHATCQLMYTVPGIALRPKAFGLKIGLIPFSDSAAILFWGFVPLYCRYDTTFQLSALPRVVFYASGEPKIHE